MFLYPSVLCLTVTPPDYHYSYFFLAFNFFLKYSFEDSYFAFSSVLVNISASYATVSEKVFVRTRAAIKHLCCYRRRYNNVCQEVCIGEIREGKLPSHKIHGKSTTWINVVPLRAMVFLL